MFLILGQQVVFQKRCSHVIFALTSLCEARPVILQQSTIGHSTRPSSTPIVSFWDTKQVKRLSDIENIDRFAEPEMEGPLCDMLWADPLNEDDSHKLTDDEYRQFLDTDYIANQVTHCLLLVV